MLVELCGRPGSGKTTLSQALAAVIPVVLLRVDAIEAALRIHGNLGYSADFPFGQRLKDVLAYLVADGTSEIQKRIIAKDVLSRV